MRQKLPCLLLTGALALGLAACAPGGEVPSPGPTPSQPVEADAPSQPLETAPPVLTLPPEPSDPPAAEYDLPERDYQPWQTAYMDFLTALQRAEQGNLDAFFEHGPYFDPAEERPDGETPYDGLAVDDRGCYVENMDGIMPLTQVMEVGSETYSLYDVDRDSVPELFVSYDGWYTQCYTYRDGQVVCIGEFHSKDRGLYSHPEHHSVLVSGGRMGYYDVYEYPMEGGRLTEGQKIFSEGPVDFWTETGEVIPGAERLPYYYTRLGDWQRSYASYIPEGEYLVDDQIHASAGKALVLPVADWQIGRAVTGDSSETARAAILSVLNGEGKLFGASGDHFYGDVGWMSWAEYIQPEAVYPYNDVPFTVQAYVWQDMNGDGQEECVLQLAAEDEGQNTLTVVLSEQDGAVYAYAFGFLELARDTIEVGYPYQSELYTDGALLSQYGEVTALSFWKGQCYQYAAQRDPSAQPVKWLDGAPQGG